MPDHEAIHDSWRHIIDDLESDLARVESGAVTSPNNRMASADWSPPSIAGPLPDEYANYVRELIERQREAVIRLEETRRLTSGHLGALRAASSGPADAIYLDVEG